MSEELPPVPIEARPLFDPAMFPEKRRSLATFLVDHNPCLLLSTVCMLLGCYLVNSAFKENAATFKTVSLLGVVNLYEACIIPLGLVLIRRTKGAARDGLWLVLVECLFIVNATYVNVDFGPHWSWPFHAALFFLACMKAGILFSGLKIGLRPRTFGFLMVQLAVIYGMPALFWLVQVDGVVSPRVMYGLWWIVGLLPGFYLWLTWNRGKAAGEKVESAEHFDVVQNVIRRTYVIVPWILMVMHVSFSHWAHHSDFQLADVAPPLLGLALASTRIRLSRAARVWAGVLPIVALVCSLPDGEALRWTIRVTSEPETLVPLHFALAGLVIVYGFMISPFHGRWASVAVGLAAVGFLWQSWIYEFGRWAARTAERSNQVFMDLIPATAFGWGIVAIVTSFFLLAIGSFIGLRRTTARIEAL